MIMTLPCEIIIHIISYIQCIDDVTNCIVNTYFKSLIFHYIHALYIPNALVHRVNPVSVCNFYNLKHIKGGITVSQPKDILKYIQLNGLRRVKFKFDIDMRLQDMFYEYVYEYIKNISIGFENTKLVFDYIYEFAGIDFNESIHIHNCIIYIFGTDPQYKFTRFAIESGKFHQIIYGSFHMGSTFKELLNSYIHKIKLIGNYDMGISSILIY